MKKKSRISPEESDEFRKNVEDVKPLDNNNTIEPNTHSKKTTIRLRKDEENNEQDLPLIQFELSHQKDWHEAQDCIHSAESGVPHQVVKKMRRGQLRINDRLDLHQMNRNEALEAMNRFINKAQARGFKNLLIIHGKGFDQAILKNLTSQYLRQDQRVLAFHSATPRDGGTGAVYVLIKSKPRNQT